MAIDEKILRINELSKKSKTVGLTESEQAEQKKLREEYVKSFRDSLKSTLDNTYIVDEAGNKTKVTQNENHKKS